MTTTPYEKALEAVSIAETVSGCNTFNYLGSAETTSPTTLNWFWEFGDGQKAEGQNVTHPYDDLNSSNAENPVATPSVSTVCTVSGTGQNGCSNTDSVLVKVTNVSNTVYELPNSFTPNGDGLNDCIEVNRWGHLEKLDLQIFNRSGQQVFYSNNTTNCWDGRYKGEMQPNGAFIYLIKAKTFCGDIERKGIIYLLK